MCSLRSSDRTHEHTRSIDDDSLTLETCSDSLPDARAQPVMGLGLLEGKARAYIGELRRAAAKCRYGRGGEAGEFLGTLWVRSGEERIRNRIWAPNYHCATVPLPSRVTAEWPQATRRSSAATHVTQ